ncbi:MAG: hypothetical protein A2452_04335 [Candidatus Firestonebacteria bacterium RIFOXYC2_FULL_39_67]|nr:MAG: hypothetical protein A2536_11230 [Candidatus Firestonebacteria bacterium RIFOXYD2_FULL_39_29]OGF54398.1 MAG: hypothetical protein A2452_04335 [Candidatus Firestonebacteria bacterium RIFOXYC2_FULL_39_67]
MSVKFITNQEKVLAEVINNILPSTKNWNVLVGYFYFSGFQEIYGNLKEKHVKILVGMNAGVDAKNMIQEFISLGKNNLTRGEQREEYYSSLVNIISETKDFDTLEKQEAFRLFLEKINNGTLEIRKTVEPTHAKLYIFEHEVSHSQGGTLPGTIITGSSNLTYSGLKKNYEINVISRDTTDYAESVRIFEELWNSSILLADKATVEIFMRGVVDKIFIDKLPTPYELYIKVLDEYFTRYTEQEIKLPHEITEGKYINLKYQEDAIKRAIDIIKKHNGVIIADVVGLGKSIIASAVAHNLGLRAVVIAPPHLKEQWEEYHNQFEFSARVYSSGKIEEALEQLNDEKEKLIIIDEAHKYRNEMTTDYANLHKLCQKNKVMLLTATPFNNKPQDVFSMIRLFQITTRSTIQTVENLSYEFRTLIKEYNELKTKQKKESLSPSLIKKEIERIAGKIRDIMSPVVIRRSRLDLEAIDDYKKDLKAQKIEFPKVKPPVLLEYELGDLTGLYIATLDKIENNFKGARYKPAVYLIEKDKYVRDVARDLGIDVNLLKQGQANLADFMRRLLVRRFESSICAFRKTLGSMIKSSTTILEWYDRVKKVPIYKKGQIPDVSSLFDSEGDDVFKELESYMVDEKLEKYEEKGFAFVDIKELSPDFKKYVLADIELLKEILAEWPMEEIASDPKLKGFLEKVKKSLEKDPKRKIVVFTEFSDTADYLFKELKDTIRVFKYSSKDSSPQNKSAIKKNFDAGIPEKQQENNYDVLVATDAISEGFNLHRAGTIFNYDIPYNPTRVIQRIGRINRINKKVFDELYIYNFFPTATGEKEINTKKITTLKISMIHALFGEDAKVLTNDEELQSFFKKQYEEEIKVQEALSPEAKYENIIRNLKASKPEFIKNIKDITKRVRIKRTQKKDSSGVIVFGKKGSEYSFKFAGSVKDEAFALPVAEALKLFEAAASEKSEKVSKEFYPVYEKIYENLFTKRSEIHMDKGKRDAIEKISSLINKVPAEKDYLEDLKYVMKDLDSLPNRFMKEIRAIEDKDIENGIKALKKQVPQSYLMSIRAREKSVDEGKETLILSEELI